MIYELLVVLNGLSKCPTRFVYKFSDLDSAETYEGHFKGLNIPNIWVSKHYYTLSHPLQNTETPSYSIH